MSIRGVGSFTVFDYNDGVTINASILANHPQGIAYDPATGAYTPSWQTLPLNLKPVATVSGKTGDIISGSTNKNWYYRRTGDENWTSITNGVNGFTISAASELGYTGHALFDSSHPTLEFKFEFTYYDTTLKINVDTSVTISFTRISNGTSVVIAYAESAGGDRFVNGADPAYIDLSTRLMRGTVSDDTSLSYQWQKLSGETWSNISGATSSTYRVLPSSVNGSAQFRCKITDNDPASDTYNDTFTTNGLIILDYTDPIVVRLVPVSGTGVLKNGQGSCELKAEVIQNGVEIDAGGSSLNYRWYKVGVGTTLGTGKTYTITSDQVDASNTFNCEVTD